MDQEAGTPSEVPDPAPAAGAAPAGEAGRRAGRKRVVLAVAAVVVAGAGFVGYRLLTDEPVSRMCTLAMPIETPVAPGPEEAYAAFLARFDPPQQVGWKRHSRTEWRRYDGPESYVRIQVRREGDGWAVFDNNRCSEWKG